MALGLDSTMVGALLARDSELAVESLRRGARRRAASWLGNGYCASGDEAEGEFSVSCDGRKAEEFILKATITTGQAVLSCRRLQSTRRSTASSPNLKRLPKLFLIIAHVSRPCRSFASLCHA